MTTQKTPPRILVVMGVSGSGKSTLAGLLAGRLGWPLQEGDDLHPAANTKLLNLTGIAVITLNEQITNADGSLTVNAVHIQLGSVNSSNVGTLGDVILGSATCGPNAVTAPVDAFSFGSTPIVLIALAIVVAAGFGIRTGLRRVTSRA